MRTARVATPGIGLQERTDVRWIRHVFQRWPLPRGKGILLRIFARWLARRPFLFSVEPGVLIPGALEDYMVLWAFTNDYKADASVRLSRALLREGDRVLDIGAHIGLWVMGAARRIGATGAAYAVEPDPDNYRRLRDNLRLNDLERIATSPVAMSDSPGAVALFRPDYNHSGHPSMARRDGLHDTVEVTATTLDLYCEQSGLHKLDFLKVDVEGAEMLVFRGGERLLGSPDAPAILFEVNEETAASFGCSCAEVKSLLRTFGYEIFRYDGVAMWKPRLDQPEPPGDCFALKAHHLDRIPSSLRA
jgi:FkbM family methyltransferase